MVSWVRGKCIGKGSFGNVSIAFDKFSSAVFAVKSVQSGACSVSEANEALENEIRILRSVCSPYIVDFLGEDVSYENSSHYRNLHMEYLPGGTVADLATLLRADVDERIVRSYTWCLVSALSYLHSRGIVHCDVKGKNVLVGNSPGSAKLADFGSAAEVTGGDKIQPRGSPLWMAPEVILGEYQGRESDVWSLGCTVIEMVTGKPAWEDRGVDTLSKIGFSDELPELPTQLSELGRDFLDKCLRRDPKERWSCDQLLKHPFISSAAPDMITESSPRCVLDWPNSDFEDDDVEEGQNVEDVNEAWAKNRIGKLATNGGANWEGSDGWVAVRSYADDGASKTEEEVEEGTSSVYSDSERISEGSTTTTIMEDGTKLELQYAHVNGHFGWRCGVGDSGGGGGCGSQEVELLEVVVLVGRIYCGLYNFLLLLLLLLGLIFTALIKRMVMKGTDLLIGYIPVRALLLFSTSIRAYDCVTTTMICPNRVPGSFREVICSFITVDLLE